MSKKEENNKNQSGSEIYKFQDDECEENLIDLGSQNSFDVGRNLETVPYLNNEGDLVQDMLVELETSTLDLQADLFSENDANVLEVDFSGGSKT